MESGFVAILQKLVDERGRETLLDYNRAIFKAILDDYTRNEYKDESRRLLKALDARVQKAIDTAGNITICKKQQISVLHKDHDFDEKIAADVVDTLALVLRGDTSRTEIQKEEPMPEKAKRTATVKPQRPVTPKNIVSNNSGSFTISNQSNTVVSAPSATNKPTNANPTKRVKATTIIKKPLFWVVISIALVGVIGGLYFAFFLKDYNVLEGHTGGNRGLDAFMESEDPELVGAALPSTIATYEGLLAKHPKRQELLLTTGSLLVMYANAFVQGPAEMLDPIDSYRERLEGFDRAKKLYIRGKDILYSALENKFPGFANATFQEGTLAPLLRKCKKDDVPLLYWTAAGGFAAYFIDVFDFDLGYNIPEWASMMARAYELDPDFSEGAIDEFYILYYASLPERMGGDKAKAEIHFKRALEKSGGLAAEPYVLYAKTVCADVQEPNYDAFLENLEKALAIDPDQNKSNRLFNILAQRKAKHMLDTADDYFPVLQ